MDELAPEGALQVVLARRVAVAAWRLARADRMEVELFEERRWEDAGVGMALIRDGNGTRSFETLMRYRGAAMAEFWRALKTLKALQAEPAAVLEQPRRRAGDARHPACRAGAGARAVVPTRSAPRARRSPRTERTRAPHGRTCCPNRPIAGPALHEPAASWMPNEPETGARAPPAPSRRSRSAPSGRSCERRRAHTIGSGRRRAPDSAW